jgi:hypothetical protein
MQSRAAHQRPTLRKREVKPVRSARNPASPLNKIELVRKYGEVVKHFADWPASTRVGLGPVCVYKNRSRTKILRDIAAGKFPKPVSGPGERIEFRLGDIREKA